MSVRKAVRILVAYPESSVAQMIPAGPPYIVSSLKRAGHDVLGMIYRRQDHDALESSLEDVSLVATGGLSCQFHELKSIVQAANKMGIATVAGGGIISSETELMTRALGSQYGVIGEGEQTMVELAEHVANGGNEASRITGLAWFDRHYHYHQNPPRKENRDLDSLPWPDYDAFGYESYLDSMLPSDSLALPINTLFDQPREYPIVTSRSCPYHCSFCFHPSGYIYRQRSMDSVMAELRWAVPKYRINVVTVLDELFSANPFRIREFCDGINLLRSEIDWPLVWACQMHVKDVDRDMLKTMKRAGCVMVAFGLESHSQEILNNINKKSRVDQMEWAIDCCFETGLTVGGNFIIGMRGETWKTAEDTIRFWRRIARRGTTAAIGTLVVCPNSPDYQECIRSGLITDRLKHTTHNLYRPINLTALPDSQFWKLLCHLAFRIARDTPCIIPRQIGPDTIRYRCRFCRKVNTMKRFSLPRFDMRRVMCRHCHKGNVLIWRLSWWTRYLVSFLPEWGWLFKLYSVALKIKRKQK